MWGVGLGLGRRWRRGRSARSGTGMGTQEALPRSAGVQEGGTARDRGRGRPGAASSPERHRPPVDPPPRPAAPPPGRGRRPELRREGTYSRVGWGGGVSAGVGGDAGPSPSPTPATPSWLSRDGGREQSPDIPTPPGRGVGCGGGMGDGDSGRESRLFNCYVELGDPPPIPHSQLRREYAGTALRTQLPRLYLAGRSPGHPVRRPLPPLPREATASLFTTGRVRGAGTRLHRPRLVVCEVTDGWRWERRKQVFKKRVCSCPRLGPPPHPVPCTPPVGSRSHGPGGAHFGGPRLHAYRMRAPCPENLAYWVLSFPAFRRTFPVKHRPSLA